MQIANRITEQMEQTNSLVCVGLDPIENLIPPNLKKLVSNREKIIYQFLLEVIDITAPLVCSFKIQKAFFDQYEFGHRLIKNVIKYSRQKYSEKVIIIDCKIGDVAHTLNAYLHNLFGNLNSDSIIVNPYMGNEIFELCDQRQDKLFIMLVRTSNPGGSLIQDILLQNGQTLWENILGLVCEKWHKHKNCIPVLSFTNLADEKRIRKLIPSDMPIFWAGYGAQERDLSSLKFIVDKDQKGVIVNSSRGILYSNYNSHAKWQDAVFDNAIAMRNSLNKLRAESI